MNTEGNLIPKESDQENWIQPVVLAIAIAACSWTVIQFGEFPAVFYFVQIGFVVILLVSRLAIGCYGFLTVALGSPLLWRRGPEDHLNGFDIVFALMLLGFVALSFRYLGVFAKRLAGSRIYIERAKSDRRLGTVARQNDRGVLMADVSRRLRPWFGPWHYIVLSVAIGLLVLWLFPLDRTTPRTIGLLPVAARTIVISWILVISIFTLSTGLGLVAWWRLSPAEAGVYLRSALSEEIDRDLSPIERRRARILRTVLKEETQ